MKIRKLRGYINYGSTPRNEYTTTNIENNTNAVLEHDTQEDDITQKQRSPKPRMQYKSSRGWKRSVKVNGWRAELASRQDESMGVRRYYNYVVGEKSTLLNKGKPVNDQKKM